MNAQEIVESLTERVPDGLRDVASDVDRVARAAAERVPDGLRDVASDVDRVTRAAVERAQAEAARSFDSRFEADRRAAERQRTTAAAAAVVVLVLVGIGVVIFVAQRRRSRRLQRFVDRAQAAWSRATGRPTTSSAERPTGSSAERPVAPVAINGAGITAGGQWQESVAHPATTTLEVERV